MVNTTLQAMQTAAELALKEKNCSTVLGFTRGSLALRAAPVFIDDAKKSASLVMDGFCQNNLVSLLHTHSKTEKTAVILRGCETRAVRALVIEKQFSRENLHIIGIPCTGILDMNKIERAAGGEVTAAEDTGTQLFITVSGKRRELPRADFVHSACKACRFPNPVGADEVIGELIPEPGLEYQDELSGMSLDERLAFFREETSRCIRCYACREACPMCYCAECFVDHNTPRWAVSTAEACGQQAWHLIRAFHQTGRCVECGACERACPMEIHMEYLTARLNEDMHAQYGFTPGESDSAQPPFAAFSLDDRGRFNA